MTKNYLAILEYGLNFSYLYDIISLKDNSIGLHLGTGVGIAQYLSQSFSVYEINTDITIFGGIGGINNYKVGYAGPRFALHDIKVSSRVSFDMHFNIGVHYAYHTHHWFFINYYYREVSGNKINLNNGLKTYNPHQQSHIFAFSYTYKF